MPPRPGAVDETSAVAGPAGGCGGPTNLVVLLLDSLNRHMLGCYGGTEFETPNLDRFAAERAVRFTSHVTGSLPCMPARHDILCGSLDFLWRPWGSIEVWEEPITAQLRRAGVTTMLVSDHPHLFETGGENYHTDFSAWDYVRGHEGDPWRTYGDPSHIGAPALPARGGGWFWRDRLGWAGALDRPYDRSRTFFREELDFPGPRVMRTAADWLRRGAPAPDAGAPPFLLFVDEFDPHEPFDTPAPWAGRYDPGWEGELLIWPPYDVGAVGAGRLSAREGQQLRANYGAKLSMIDHWVGEVFSALTERGLWESTAVIVCTDHGHYLGEKDIWGKPGVMQYETLGHIPLLVSWPGAGRGTQCGALTTNVDLHATIADVFGVAAFGGVGGGGGSAGAGHGVSLLPLVRGEAPSVRDWAVGGVYGNWVQVTDGRHKYARGAAGSNFPLSMWSNRWSTMPVHGLEDTVRLPPPDRRARLDFMPGSEVPVIRQPFEPGDRLPYWVGGNVVDRHFLFDLDSDPGEDENLVGTQTEADMVELLRVALAAVEAPAEQLERLGIS
ncbi:MAG TPA: sulfatase-like hydrolase/transferase [Acidimicrobiales bacterium]|nr:sulfatase-like hydrolase/transferase [Acidimicrobiales bacterium]